MSSFRMTTSGGLVFDLSHPSPQDRAFIFASSIRQLRTIPGLRELSDFKFQPYVRMLEDRYDDPSTTVYVALDPDDPWLVLGFVFGTPATVSTPAVISWLHVRGGVRGLGLATSLAAVMGSGPGQPTVIEYPTWDLIREEAGDELPVGLLHNPHWSLSLRFPWPKG